MTKIKFFLLAASSPILVGCPYVDHGTTHAPDRVVTSIEEIQGCYYQENIDEYKGLVCEEICIDSLAHYNFRSFGKNNEGNYTVLKKDTSFFTKVEFEKPLRDGTYDREIFIKDVGISIYREDSGFAQLVGFRGNTRVNTYSTKGWSQCEF